MVTSKQYSYKYIDKQSINISIHTVTSYLSPLCLFIHNIYLCTQSITIEDLDKPFLRSDGKM